MADDYGRLNVALIPSVPEQEAQAEAERLRGARNLPEPQQSTSWADPIDTTPGDHDVTPYGGKSAQIPSTPPGSEGASAVSHQHYWIHTVTETIDRGYFGFNSVAMTLAEGVPVRILGLDDLRPRAELELLAQADSNTAVYVGDRDVINSDSPQSTGIWLGTSESEVYYGGGTFTYRARKELWAIAVGGPATIGVTSYQSEPTSDDLATQSKSGAGAK